MIAFLGLLTGLLCSPVAATASSDVPNGQFFTEALPDRDDGGGFAVQDGQGAKLWTAFTAAGGVDALGYPISEPVWVHATIADKPDQPVLVQIFERRTLSFNVQNAPEWRVDLGNVGQQYYAWRYGAK